MIKAVTFDLWDTMVYDDSDEPERAARGLRSKKGERRHLVWQALDEIEPHPAHASLVQRFDFFIGDVGFDRADAPRQPIGIFNCVDQGAIIGPGTGCLDDHIAGEAQMIAQAP
jgi:hypothetical protein